MNGWYTRPVGIRFSGSDRTSGIAACTNTTYGGPDSGAASLAGTCTDWAGNVSAPFGYGLKYDATAPVVTGANPERPANAGGWFNRPVRFDIQAGDATSGIADCPDVTYGGPDSATASFVAGCRDSAGNTSSRVFGLKYDATPPAVADLGATAGDGIVALSWQTSADAESVEVARTPGVGGDSTTVIFRGPGSSLADSSRPQRHALLLRGAGAGRCGKCCQRHRERRPDGWPPRTATCRTLEGGSRQAGTTAPPPLDAGSRRRLLQRSALPEGAKILSVWPSRAQYQLKRRWTYRGRVRRLVPGRYRWLVWPGFGPRSRADYGRRLGPSIFVVRRPT